MKGQISTSRLKNPPLCADLPAPASAADYEPIRKIIETSGVAGDDFVQVWAKNVGASNIPSLTKIDVFFGETDGFERIAYDPEATCPNPSPPPRTENCWQFALENDTEWTPYATLRITVYLTYDLEAGTDYVSTIVLPNGLSASRVFTL